MGLHFLLFPLPFRPKVFSALLLWAGRGLQWGGWGAAARQRGFEQPRRDEGKCQAEAERSLPEGGAQNLGIISLNPTQPRGAGDVPTNG